MRAALVSFGARLGAADVIARHGFWRSALFLTPHVIAFAVMIATESRSIEMAAFACAWGILNFFWLVLLRRPTVAGALSLLLLTLLSVHDLPGAALDRGVGRRRAVADYRPGVAVRSVPR